MACRNYQHIYKNLLGATNFTTTREIVYPTLNYSEPTYHIPGIINAKLDEYEKSLKLSSIIDDAEAINRSSPDVVHPYVQVAISIFLFEVCLLLLLGDFLFRILLDYPALILYVELKSHILWPF